MSDDPRHGEILPWLEVGVAWWRKKPRPWFVACHVCGGLGLKDYERPAGSPNMVWIHFCKTRARIARAIRMHRRCSPCGHPGKPLPLHTDSDSMAAPCNPSSVN